MKQTIWVSVCAVMLAGCAISVYPNGTQRDSILVPPDAPSDPALDPMFSPVAGVAVLAQEWQSALVPSVDFRRETLTVDGVGNFQVTRIYPNRLPFTTEVIATGSLGVDRVQNLINRAFYREDLSQPRFVDLPALLESPTGTESAGLSQTTISLSLKYGRHSVKNEGANNPVFGAFSEAIARETLSLPLSVPEASASTASL